MLAQVRSYTLFGLDAVPVTVEVDVSPGLPSYALVGLPDKAVEESRERVRAALKNTGFPYPQARVVVNLAPAELRKEGSHFDLPIALGLLAAQGVVPLEGLAGLAVAGELGLDGTLRPVPGAVNLALGALGEGKKLLLPLESAKEAALVEGVEVYGVENLLQAVAYLRGEEEPRRVEPDDPVAALEALDLRDVKGQAKAKRALEIAAAGYHHLLMVGSPGSGKTMLARRLPFLLPPLRQEAALEVSRIHSAAGQILKGLVRTPPFRAPHHTVSYAGLIGGGAIPKPGEVTHQKKGNRPIGGKEDLLQGARLGLLGEAEGEVAIGEHGGGPEQIPHQDGLEGPEALVQALGFQKGALHPSPLSGSSAPRPGPGTWPWP